MTTKHNNPTGLTRRRALATAGGGAAALWLTACGGGGKQDDQAAKPLERKQEEVKSILWPREDTSARAVKGGIFQSYIVADATSLDPLSATSTTATGVSAWVYPRLLSVKPGFRKPSTGELEGYLAATWEQPDPLTLVMKLRPEAVWEDKAPTSKRPIDADDVLFSWRKFAASGLQRTTLAKSASPSAPVEDVTATDKHTVVFKLAFPYAPLASFLASNRFLVIMPREADGGFDPRNETRSGGPWMLKEFQRSVKFEYRKNPHYWDANNVLLDGFDQPIIPEYAAGMAQFRAKRVWSFAARQEDIIQTKKDLPELAIDYDEFARPINQIFWGYQPDSPFRDERVRQAVSLMLDRDAYIDSFANISQFQKEGYPTEVRYNSHIGAGWEGIWTDPRSAEIGEGQKFFKKDIAEAKKLLTAAGYPNGFEIPFIWLNAQYGASFSKLAEVVLAMIEEAGLIKPKVSNPEYQTEYLPRILLNKGDFKGMGYALGGDYPDIDGWFSAHFESRSQYRKAAYQDTPLDPQLDQMIYQQRQELDAKKRLAQHKAIQRHLAVKMWIVPHPGQSPPYNLFWPWIGNAGVYRPYGAGEGRNSAETRLWFDKSKYTG